jgi:transcriptional regulator with XRE-family HTH domain
MGSARLFSRPNHTAKLLTSARVSAGLSQLALACALDVSQRHVSFVELGRARPSRALVIAWIEATRAPDDWRRAALQAAGYSDRASYEAEPCEGTLPDALRPLLRSPSASPLFVIDARWRILDVNRAARCLAGMVMPAYWRAIRGAAKAPSFLDALIDKRGLLHRMPNAAQAAHAWLRQLERDALFDESLDEGVRDLAASVARRFRLPLPLPRAECHSVARLDFATERAALSFHPVRCAYSGSVVAHGGSIRVEHWVPADAETHEFLSAAVDAGSGSAGFAMRGERARPSG